MVTMDDIVDPNFTQGLRSEYHLDYTRAGMLGGRVHLAHVAALREIDRLRWMAYQPAAMHKPGCDCIQCVPF